MANLPEVCLLECLMPPPGHQFVGMVGSTYSLAPSVLLAMLVAATTPRRDGEPFALERSKEEILEAIRTAPKRCLIFCDHHATLQENGGLSSHEKLALHCVVKKEGRANNNCGSLHGKVVIALFQDDHRNHRARLYVGSKNLTDTPYEEFGVVVDLEEVKANDADPVSLSVAAYLRYLHDWEGAHVQVSTKLDPLRMVLDVLQKRRFRCSLPGVQFHWQGRRLHPDRPLCWTPLAQALRAWVTLAPAAVYIHSPWARATAIDHFVEACGDKTRIVLRCLDERQLAIRDNPLVRFDFYHGSGGQLERYQSHAKVYLFRWKTDALLAFGSANCTGDGWGIETATGRTNSEVLLALPCKFVTYQKLADLQGEVVAPRPAQPRDVAAADHAREYLEAIRVDVVYDTEAGALCYCFDWPADHPHRCKRVKVVHDLVETTDDITSLVIWDGTGVPSDGVVRRQYDAAQLYLLSPLMRLIDPDSGAQVHLVVDLDTRFVEGQAQLRCMQYTTEEFVESLARLMEVSIDGGNHRTPGTPQESHDIVERFIAGLRLERYLYRMARLKHTSQQEFAETINRVDRLVALKADDPRMAETMFGAAMRAIRDAHGVLNEVKRVPRRHRRNST